MNREFSDYAEQFLSRADHVAQELQGQIEKIASAMEILFTTWIKRKRVFVTGTGGSASTASHLAADLVKTVVENPGDPGLKALALNDNIPLMSALTNDWGWDRGYDSQLATFWEPESVVIAISVNGGAGKDKAGLYSQNLVRALKFAKDHGGVAIGMAGNKYDGGVFKDICDVCLVVPDGTPFQVEPFHVVLNHLITAGLKEKIRGFSPR